MVIVVAVVVAFGATGLVACSGDDGPTAEERAQAAVCRDADALQQSAEKFVGELTDGNFGDAEQQFSKVESALDDLVASADELVGEKQQTIEGQLTEVQTTLAGLTSLDSLTDIGTALDDARSQLEQLLSTVTDTLSCS
jgi:hypothetical protein